MYLLASTSYVVRTLFLLTVMINLFQVAGSEPEPATGSLSPDSVSERSFKVRFQT